MANPCVPFEGEFGEFRKEGAGRKGNQSKHGRVKRRVRLYEAEKFQSLTNICRMKAPCPETLCLFVLQNFGKILPEANASYDQINRRIWNSNSPISVNSALRPRSSWSASGRILHGKVLVNLTEMVIQRCLRKYRCWNMAFLRS